MPCAVMLLSFFGCRLSMAAAYRLRHPPKMAKNIFVIRYTRFLSAEFPPAIKPLRVYRSPARVHGSVHGQSEKRSPADAEGLFIRAIFRSGLRCFCNQNPARIRPFSEGKTHRRGTVFFQRVRRGCYRLPKHIPSAVCSNHTKE